jgi:hypothetical protein
LIGKHFNYKGTRDLLIPLLNKLKEGRFVENLETTRKIESCLQISNFLSNIVKVSKDYDVLAM